MYLALYRKYRPRTFDDVISQEHITTTLKNQISTGTAAHAYLFTGSRGTGKTTCAKILAMAVNCLSPINGSPCLECAACREIADGSAVDIVEMDAASNNGVDDVRQLRDEMSYTPVSCKYRVYIIDEVHMLSSNAFNALLKTLEEPPAHVKFILATTELHKVLPTIISRCQRFDFCRINPKDSVKRLMYVAQQEGFSLDEDAAELISSLSDGGMRDALSLLDRCMNIDGGHVTAQGVRSCAGVADSRYLYSFSQMIAQSDSAGCIRLLNELYADSKDIARIVDELSAHYRDLMLCKAAPNGRELLNVVSAEYETLDKAAELYSLEDILRCLTLLQQCADSIGKTRQRKTLAEMCLVRMCMKLDSPSESAHKLPVMSVVRPAPSANLPAGTAVQIFDVEQPAEKFEPTPEDKLSPQNAAALNMLRALKREGELANAVAQENLPPQPPLSIDENPPSAQSEPVLDMAGEFQPPLDGLVPPPEMEQEFTVLAETVTQKAEPVLQNLEPAQQKAELTEQKFSEQTDDVLQEAPDNSVSSGEENASDLPISQEEQTPLNQPPLISITQPEWENTLEKLSPMTSALFRGTSASVKDGALEIRTSSLLLAQSMSGFESYEKEVQEALGADIRIKIVQIEEEKTTNDEPSAVEKLLSKAKELNIEIIYK